MKSNEAQRIHPKNEGAVWHRAGLRLLLLTVAFLAFGTPSSFAQMPRMSNGSAVDGCLHWAVECGKPAADEYCRRAGYPAGSATFTIGRMRPTWVLGDNRVCNADYCTGFTSLQCSTGATNAAGPKMSNGSAVDGCLHWGVECGKPAADEYCRRAGYPAGSATFTLGRMRPTWVLGDNRVCNADYCTGFTSLQCSAGGATNGTGGVITPPPPGGGILSYYIDAVNGPHSLSTAPLQSGVRYVVEVSGTFSYWGANVADSPEGGVDPVWCYAKWRCPTAEKWQSVHMNDKGLADFSGQPLPYNPQHVYRIEVIGGGSPVKFDIYQSHGGMIGGINIRIYPR